MQNKKVKQDFDIDEGVGRNKNLSDMLDQLNSIRKTLTPRHLFIGYSARTINNQISMGNITMSTISFPSMEEIISDIFDYNNTKIQRDGIVVLSISELSDTDYKSLYKLK